MKKWFWVLDALVVLSFVVVGRDSHGFVTEWGETVRVAAPFLIALAIGIVVTRAWRRPLHLLTGLGVGVITLVLGMLLRRFVWDDGTATTFIVVTSGWIIGLMVAWRAAALAIANLRSRRSHA